MNSGLFADRYGPDDFLLAQSDEAEFGDWLESLEIIKER